MINVVIPPGAIASAEKHLNHYRGLLADYTRAAQLAEDMVAAHEHLLETYKATPATLEDEDVLKGLHRPIVAALKEALAANRATQAIYKDFVARRFR